MGLIPDSLRNALEDGEVVFFCGAGVSKPAGLPTFYKLVETVLSDLLPSENQCPPDSTSSLAWKAFRRGNYDEALDILENRSEGGYEPRDVRENISNQLKKKVKTLKYHHTLAQLADLNTDHGRLVTTNFDHLFEKATKKLRRAENIKEKLTTFVAPALPPAKPRTSYGLTYLHGKLGCSEEDKNLVLTTADFGTAYLLEGWASRYLIELFQYYHVLFLGYRVEDPVVRYLVSALAASREESKIIKDSYVFAAYGGNNDRYINENEAIQEWKLRGLIPLTYENSDGTHNLLWQELEEWANDHHQGILGRQQIAARLGKYPPIDQRDPAIDKLCWVLDNKIVAKSFSKLKGTDRPHPGWINFLQLNGLLDMPIGKDEDGHNISSPLVSDTITGFSNLNGISFNLGFWIAGCLDSRESLDWAMHGGCVLHKDLRREIRFKLDLVRKNKLAMPPALFKIWRVMADDNYAHSLSASRHHLIIDYPPLAQNDLFAIRTFMDRLRPIPVFTSFPEPLRNHQVPDPNRPSDWCDIRIELVGIQDSTDIVIIRDRSKDWIDILASLADEITTRLNEALDWLNEFGLASAVNDPTYIEYRSISPHKQNTYAHTWTSLISLARDSYDALVDIGKSAEAKRLIRRWQSIPYPVFRRLALYAATGGSHA